MTLQYKESFPTTGNFLQVYAIGNFKEKQAAFRFKRERKRRWHALMPVEFFLSEHKQCDTDNDSDDAAIEKQRCIL